MIKIGICNDEQRIINHLYQLIQKILNKQGNEYEIYTFTCGQSILDCNEDLDILFLDIQINKINGISVGKQLSNKADIKIIYISNYKKYCMEAINKVHAFAYLEKPINENNFEEQLLAAVQSKEIRKMEDTLNFEIIFIEIDTIKKVIKEFKVKDIYYFEFVNRKIKIKLKQNEYFFIGKLKDVEQNMEKYHFVRCHSAYVINTKHITRLNKLEVVLDNEERIPIAQRRACEFRKKVNSYLYIFSDDNGKKNERS